MFSHIMIGSNDIARSEKILRCPCLSRWGAQPGVEDARAGLAYTHDGGRFMVSKPSMAKPATHANGGTIGFTMSGPERAAAWHQSRCAKAVHDRNPPGVRQGAPARCISLTSRSDGNKLCRALSQAGCLNYRRSN